MISPDAHHAQEIKYGMEISTPGRLRGFRARDPGTASAIRESIERWWWYAPPISEEEGEGRAPSPEEVERKGRDW